MEAIASRTPLYQAHVDASARIIEFGGWLMPVQYSGILQEHRAVREAVGLFDICHMGQIRVSGRRALDFVQMVATNDASTLKIGQAQYALLCYEDGGVVDDIFVYRLEDCYFIVVNAANNEKDYQWLLEHSIPEADVENVSKITGMLSLQGPLAERSLQPLTDLDLSRLPNHYAVRGRVAGVQTLIGRTGYTGEDGFELFCPREQTETLWNALRSSTPLPQLCGLGARDTLRLEAKMPLYGHEIDQITSPIEAGLGWAVKLDKPDFIGKAALQEIMRTGPRRKLVCLEMIDNGIARAGFPVLKDGREVGHVTSGTFSPALGKAIAIAYVPVELAQVGSEVSVAVRERPLKARVLKPPFYKRGR